MDLSKITIRAMRDGEQKEMQQIGKRAFQFVEALFVGRPQKAMAAEYEGRLVGGILYKEFTVRQKRIAYIDEAFVDPDYQGMGIGKKLYTETVEALWKQNYHVLTALVKDDNAGSWKPFLDNGFRRVSVYRIIKEIGIFTHALFDCRRYGFLYVQQGKYPGGERKCPSAAFPLLFRKLFTALSPVGQMVP